MRYLDGLFSLFLRGGGIDAPVSVESVELGSNLTATHDPATNTVTLAAEGGGFAAEYDNGPGPEVVNGITVLSRGANIGFDFPGGGTTLSISAVPRDGYERGMSLAGVVVFAIDGSVDIAANHIRGSCATTGRLHLSKSGAISGDVCTVSVTIPDAGVSFSVSTQNSTLVTLATVTAATATAGSTWEIECRYDGSSWYLWRVTNPAVVAAGPGFPISVTNGIPTLDPLSLIVLAKWRRNQALAIALASDTAEQYLLIGPNASTGIEGLETLGLNPAKTYAAILSSRITLKSTAALKEYAFIDLVVPITIVGSGYTINIEALASRASVSVSATETMVDASATIDDIDWTVRLKVLRPPGVACTAVRHDTVITDVQEIA